MSSPGSIITDGDHASTETLHGGVAVTDGKRWVAAKWLRDRRFV